MGSVIHGASHSAIKHFRDKPAAMAVYWIYLSRTNQENVAFPSIRGLARDTKWSENTCKKARDWLVTHKALEEVKEYIRPDWRNLPEDERKQKINLDHSQYYRPTGILEIGNITHTMLYFGSSAPSDIEDIADVSSGHTSPDVSSGTATNASEHRPGATELNTTPELDTKPPKPNPIKSSSVVNTAQAESPLPNRDDDDPVISKMENTARVGDKPTPAQIAQHMPSKPVEQDPAPPPPLPSDAPDGDLHKVLTVWKTIKANSDVSGDVDAIYDDIAKYNAPIVIRMLKHIEATKGNGKVYTWGYVHKALVEAYPEHKPPEQGPVEDVNKQINSAVDTTGHAAKVNDWLKYANNDPDKPLGETA